MVLVEAKYSHATPYIVGYARGSPSPCPLCSDQGIRLLAMARRATLTSHPIIVTVEAALELLHRFDVSTLFGPHLSVTRAERIARYKRYSQHNRVPADWEWVEAILRQFPTLVAARAGGPVGSRPGPMPRALDPTQTSSKQARIERRIGCY